MDPPPRPDLRVLHEAGGCAFSRSLFTRIRQNLDHGHLHSDEPLGLTYYAALCDSLRSPLDIICELADRYMELFEYKQAGRLHIGKASDEDGFTLRVGPRGLADCGTGRRDNSPLVELTNARVLHHHYLFSFHRWCYHWFEAVTVLPLVGQTVDRQQMVPFWVNRLVLRKEARFYQQSHLYWN